jgi:uncharacterized protein YndB with AHSA1/START domain
MDELAPDPRTAEEVRHPIDVALRRANGRWELVMRRRFTHSPQRLWEMLTDPFELARWSPIVPDRPLTTNGPATSRENIGDEAVSAEVLVADEPHELVHRWRGDTLRWIITPLNDGAQLELQHRFDDQESAPLFAAGWRVCLGRLAAEDGTERERATGQRALAYDWAVLREQYESDFAERADPDDAAR